MMDKKIIDVIIADVFADVALDCFLHGYNQRGKNILDMKDAANVFLPYWKDQEQKMLEDIPDKLEGMDTEKNKENAVIPIDAIDGEPHMVYECPDCKAALTYLMNGVYQLGYHKKLFAEMEHHGFIVDPTINLYGPEEIAETLNSRPELLDFFKAFMDLNPDDQARIIAAAKDTDLLSAIRNSMKVTEG